MLRENKAEGIVLNCGTGNWWKIWSVRAKSWLCVIRVTEREREREREKRGTLFNIPVMFPVCSLHLSSPVSHFHSSLSLSFKDYADNKLLASTLTRCVILDTVSCVYLHELTCACLVFFLSSISSVPFSFFF